MSSLKTSPNKFFALGITFALSLASLVIMLILIAFVQDNAPRAWGLSEFESEETILQNGVVRVEPVVFVVQNGQIFSAHIMVYDAVDLGGLQFVIDYDPNVIEVPQQPNPIVLGDFLGSTGRTVHEWENAINAVTGVITYSAFTTPISATHPGPNGDGVLAMVELKARALGTCTLDLKNVKITDIGGSIQNTSVGDGLVIVASPSIPAQVSIQKNANPSPVVPQGLLTYTLQRNFTLTSQHSYNEIVFDPIPGGVTYLAGSVTLNGLPAPQLYSSTLDAIYYRHGDIFTDTDQWEIAFQVQVASVPSGTLIANTVTETVSFGGAAYSGPYTATESTLVSCVNVDSVDLSLLTGGDIYTDTNVAFSADISPADAGKPYTYSIDYDDGTTPVTLGSSDDPLVFNHTFVAAGSYDVTISVWNCAMSAPVTDTLTVIVSEPCQDVSGVDLSLLTGGDISPVANVVFNADISPAGVSKPYTYSIDYDDGTTPVTLSSSDDPLALNHTFTAAGSYDVTISVWNCAMSAPVTDTLTVIVSESCQDVSGVDLSLLTGGDISPGANVVFSADISPADASKPYTYSIDYDDGTTPVTLGSSDDPLVFNHTFVAAGSYDVVISVWNCAMSAPVTDTVTVIVSEPCQDVSGVDLSLLTVGDIYTVTNVAFSADISPADASTPYTYSIDYDDGTTPVTLTSSDDPLALNYTFAIAGNYDVAIAVWNCAMTAIEAVTDTVQVHISLPAPPEDFLIYLPLVAKDYGF